MRITEPEIDAKIARQSRSFQFQHYSNFPGWSGAQNFFLPYAISSGRRILEIGSGANPTFPIDVVRENGFEYTTNDIDPNELDKADAGYNRLCLDFSKPGAAAECQGKFDFVFSRMVNEHVRNGRNYYSNIYAVLRPGGMTCHAYSTLFALPFLANRLMPEWLCDQLLAFFYPRDDLTRHGRFRAYYSWSRGPSNRAARRFEAIGFDVVEMIGYFGHGYYRKRLPLLDRIEQAKARFLSEVFPIGALTSFAVVRLRRS